MKTKHLLAIGAVAVSFIILMFVLTFEKDIFDNRRKIVFWQFWNPEWIQPAIDKFEAENPDYRIEVERLTWDAGFNKIVTAMAADSAPDVLEIGSTWVAGFGKDGGILSIDPGDLKEKLSNWSPALYKGGYYGVPWTLSTNAFFYNKDLLAKAGYSVPPKNWQELGEMSAKIKALGDDVYGYGIKSGRYTSWQKFMPFAWSNGAKLIDDTWTKTDVNTPAFLEALNFYNSLRASGFYEENTEVRKAFQEGRVAFMAEDPGQIDKFRKESPELNFGVSELPVSPKGLSVNFAGAQMLAVGKNTEDKDMALAFIKFMVQPENTLLITKRITTLFPAHKEAINNEFYQSASEETKVFLKILENSVSPTAHPQWEKIQEAFTEGLDKVMFDKGTPEEMMKIAEEKINAILKEE